MTLLGTAETSDAARKESGAAGPGVPVDSDAEEEVNSLTTAVQSLSLAIAAERRKRVNLPDAAVKAILRHLDPMDYHHVAPLVCKQWRKCVRFAEDGKLKPRVVLMNLVLWKDLGRRKAGALATKKSVDSLDGALKESSDSSTAAEKPKGGEVCMTSRQAGMPKTKLTTPVPLDYWTHLPETYRHATGSCMAGEGITVNTTIDDMPTDKAQVGEFLNGILALLITRVHWWTSMQNTCVKNVDPEDDAESVPQIPNVSVVPWQISIPEALDSEVDQETISTLCHMLSPRVTEIHFPPRNILHLLAPNAMHTGILRLLNVRAGHVPDLSGISAFKPLRSLELGGANVHSTSSHPVNEASDTKIDDHDFEGLRGMDSLREIYIGASFPLRKGDHGALFDIIRTLPNLKSLSVPGFTDHTSRDNLSDAQDPVKLAALALSGLFQVHGLRDVGDTFWDAVGAKLASISRPALMSLSLQYSQPTEAILRGAFDNITRHLPNLKRLVVELTPAISSQTILALLRELREKHSQLLEVQIRGIPLRVQDIREWGQINLQETGLKVRWER